MIFNPTRRRLRIAMVAGALLALIYIVFASSSALAPFLMGSVLVLFLAPIVDRLAKYFPFCERRPELALSLAIGLVYLIMAAFVAAVVLIWGSQLIGQIKDFANSVPGLIDRLRNELQSNNGWYQRNVPPDVRDQILQNWQRLGTKLGDYSESLVSRTISITTTSLTVVVSYVVVPFWVFFVVKDRAKARKAFVGLFPDGLQADVDQMIENARLVFESYIRAQLVLSTITAVVTAIGLQLFGIRFALILGLIAGVANLVPVLGPMLGSIPTLAVVTATRPGLTVLWVFLFLFLAQEFKDFVLVPRIQGRAVKMHPAVILVLIVVAGHLAGFWGLLFAVPLAAVIRDTFSYIYRRLGDERPRLVTPEQEQLPSKTA